MPEINLSNSNINNSRKYLKPEKRIEICNLYKDGFLYGEISDALSIPKSTVSGTVKKYSNNLSGVTPTRNRKPSKFTESAVNQILKVIKDNPQIRLIN